MAIESINPATGETLATYEELSQPQIDAALTDVVTSFRTWRALSFEERAQPMRRAAGYLREHRDRFARIITLEMGKPITQAEAEIEKCAWNCEFYADNATQFLADRPTPSTASQSYVAFEPLGVVLAVMPWNFPFWQVFRFAAPALMGGNTAVLKHASNVPQCALAIEEVFQESGFPEGVFRTLLVGSGAVEGIIADQRVAAVTLTGSDVAGAKVAEAAGRNLKRTVLELGGSDPFIVLGDADLEVAAKVGAWARFQNAGQSCIASKRFIVEESIADAYEERFVAEVMQLKVGDPLDHETQIGPLARADLLADLESQVQRSVEQGARVVLGGNRRPGAGAYFQPTVLTNVTSDMPVMREETFGPVAPVYRVRDADEALAVANDSQYGLGASLWTTNLDRGQALARQIETGQVFINGLVASDPRLPFGGVKRSGYGRELGEFGILEFMNIQTIWVK